MNIKLELPDYDGEAIDVIWEKNGKFDVDVSDDEVLIKANNAGLISFAKQMLYLAYNNVGDGSHIHFDVFFTQCRPKYGLIIEKNEDVSVIK